MSTPYRAAVLLTVGLSMSVGGCSLLSVKGPPEPPRSQRGFVCTESPALPVLDILGGIAYAGLGGLSLAMTEPGPTVGDVAVVVAGTGLMLTSGFVGVDRVTKCREALLEHAQRARDAPR